MADEVRWPGEKTRELLAAYDTAKVAHQPLTFADVERIWDGVVRPRLPEWAAMKEPRSEQQPPPEAARLHANWSVPEQAP